MDWRTARGLGAWEGAEMLLKIPDVRQATEHDCGAAAIEAVCRFHGVKDRGPARLANAVDGMSPATVEAVLRSLGLAVLSGTMTAGDLRHLADTGRPVLCPTAHRGGHWVVVRGVARRRVHFHCPIDGPGSLPVATWETLWSDSTRAGHEYASWGVCPSRS